MRDDEPVGTTLVGDLAQEKTKSLEPLIVRDGWTLVWEGPNDAYWEATYEGRYDETLSLIRISRKTFESKWRSMESS